jgi:hypothetical protein
VLINPCDWYACCEGCGFEGCGYCQHHDDYDAAHYGKYLLASVVCAPSIHGGIPLGIAWTASGCMGCQWLHGLPVVAWASSGCMGCQWLHGLPVVACAASGCMGCRPLHRLQWAAWAASGRMGMVVGARAALEAWATSRGMGC